LSEYVQAHEKLLRCWNCKEIINVTSCKDCSHEEPTKVCPYCGKCLHDNPKFVSGDLDHKVIKEQDGSWHIGYFLHVANCDGCENASFAAADAEEGLKDKLKMSFPLSAPYKRDPVEFAESYIKTMRNWATENLDVEPFVLENTSHEEAKPE
jgi:hypothetical protein